MPLKEMHRIKISSEKKLFRGLVALVAVLALLLCGLTVFTVVRDGKFRRQVAKQDSVIAELQQQMEDGDG